MTGNSAIPLAGGSGLTAVDGTSAIPLAVLGLCLAWHGYLVYTGKVPVPPVRWRAAARRRRISRVRSCAALTGPILPGRPGVLP